MKAVIMAGGRDAPASAHFASPKPMVPIVNQPVMEHIVGLVQAPWHRRDRGHAGVSCLR